jgi:transcriptional regulator with XRE-family HTH domain
LIEARKNAALTQEELAFRAGIERSYVSDLERGKKTPSLEVFVRICRALDLKPSDVMAQLEHRMEATEREAGAKTQ